MTESGRIFLGCNVEHRFRSHDVHAEVAALISMASNGEGPAYAALIASERERFTPCGSCLDWIFELGGADCLVIVESEPGKILLSYTASELMPHYPY
jgi:cytidine deaminase